MLRQAVPNTCSNGTSAARPITASDLLTAGACSLRQLPYGSCTASGLQTYTRHGDICLVEVWKLVNHYMLNTPELQQQEQASPFKRQAVMLAAAGYQLNHLPLDTLAWDCSMALLQSVTDCGSRTEGSKASAL